MSRNNRKRMAIQNSKIKYLLPYWSKQKENRHDNKDSYIRDDKVFDYFYII